MLTTPPLLLERHFFPEVLLKADPEYKPNVPPDLHLNLNIIKQQKPENSRRWIVQTDISVGPKEDKQGPYTVFIKAVGHFAVAENVPEAEIPSLVEVTGGSLLYSAAREYLLILTSRGPWPPLALPTVRIVPDGPKESEAPTAKNTEPKKAKAKRAKK